MKTAKNLPVSSPSAVTVKAGEYSAFLVHVDIWGRKKQGATKDLSEGQVGDSGGVSLEPSPLTCSPFPCFTLWPLLASLMWPWLFLAFRWLPGNHVLLDIQATQCAGALCRHPVPHHHPPHTYTHSSSGRSCVPQKALLPELHTLHCGSHTASIPAVSPASLITAESLVPAVVASLLINIC